MKEQGREIALSAATRGAICEIGRRRSFESLQWSMKPANSVDGLNNQTHRWRVRMADRGDREHGQCREHSCGQ